VIPATLKLGDPDWSRASGRRRRSGKFVFLGVPPGEYKVTASLTGFKTVTASGILLERGASIDVAIKMEIGSFEEQIASRRNSDDGHAIFPQFRRRSTKLLAKVPTSGTRSTASTSRHRG
jgi:hypothetical protein